MNARHSNPPSLIWGLLAGFHFSVLPAVAVGPTTAVTTQEVVLRSSPDSSESGSTLLPATRLQVLERRGDWVRVSLEGWIPAAALGTDVGGPARSPHPPTPADLGRRAIDAPASFGLRGVLRLSSGQPLRGPVVGFPVWLLPASFDRFDPEDASEDARFEELDRQARRLEVRRGAAMRLPNLADAVRQRDAAREGLARVEQERIALLAARHERHEARARAVALASTVTDVTGGFRLSCPSAGPYVVYARFVDREVALEWLESVIGGGGDSVIELAARVAVPPSE